MRLHRLRPTAGLGRLAHRAALLALVVLAGCGGGVDSGGTGAPASYASGTITGFGSIIVNGVHFDERTAVVSDADGHPRSSADLRLGMTTEVHGTAITMDAAGNSVSTARSIVFASEIVGPVAANDPVAHTLTVLGQTVDVTTSTVFDAALAGGQAALALGDVVEIYAHVDPATGHYVATRIERRTAVTEYALRGIVAGLDPAARTFTIGATRVSYAGLATAAVPSTLANGRFVRVALATLLAPGGTWTALRLVDGQAQLDADEEASVKGIVSAFVSAAQFSVNGTPIDARSARFSGAGAVKLGSRVEIEGSTSSAGVLVARDVTVEDDDAGSGGGVGGEEYEASGTITALDTAAQTFVVRGVVVAYGGSVHFDNGNAASLAVGGRVHVHGVLSADGTRVQATEIEFEG